MASATPAASRLCSKSKSGGDAGAASDKKKDLPAAASVDTVKHQSWTQERGKLRGNRRC